MRYLPLCTSAILLLLIPVSAGCGGGRPAVTQVDGTVLLDGEPVAGAAVMFVATGTRSAQGTTDEAGRFRLTAFGAEDGAVPGAHKVLISRMVPAPAAPDDPYPVARNQLPPRFANPDTTPLTAEVVSGKKNEFVFELADY